MRLSKLFLYLSVLSIPLGQFGRIPFGGNSINVYITDIAASATALIWLIETLAIKKKCLLPPLSAPIALYSAISFITLIYGSRNLDQFQFLASAMYWLRWVIYTGVYFVSADLVRTNDISFSKLKDLLIFSGIILALTGFIQLAVFPNFASMTSEGWDPHQGRLLATFFDPNFTGAYLVLALCLLLPLLLADYDNSFSRGEKKPDKEGFFCQQLVNCIATGVLALALLLTFSRSAWLMFATAVAVISLFKSRKLLILALVIAFSAYFFVPRVQTRIAGGVDPDDSAQARIVNWKQSIEIIKDNWLTGVGFNSYRYAQARYGFFSWKEPLGGKAGAGADSSVLFVFATTGIFGLASFLWIYAKTIWPTIRALATTLYSGTISIDTNQLSLLAAISGLIIESNFINSLFYTPIVIYIWILAAQQFTINSSTVYFNEKC